MRFVFFSLRFVWALIVLFVVCVAWLILFLVFLPFFLIAALFGPRQNLPESPEATAALPEANSNETTDSATPLIFDRRRDISKLFGCNTRNVQYRWNVFASRIDQLRKNNATPQALDFGAGSLRDSYELARLGFCVTSVDLDPQVMERYYHSYDWSFVHCPPKIFTEPLAKLRDEPDHSRFDLAIAFDVIEHLEDPYGYCRDIHSLLDDGGLFFSIVPNRRSIFERYFKYSIEKQRARGTPWIPGVPHLQFKSPEEWEQLFEQSGFKIIEHDMTIGFFVNDCWHGLIGLPLQVFVCPVLAMFAYVLKVKIDVGAFERAFTPSWLMKRVNVLDQVLKNRLKNRFAWNLIIAEKATTNQNCA